MMKYFFISILAIGILQFAHSCKTEESLKPQKTVITGKITNLSKHPNKTWIKIAHPDLFALESGFYEIEADSLGWFRYEFDLVSPALCNGFYGSYFDFVISPGDSLFMEINADILDCNYYSYIGDSIKIGGTVNNDYDKILEYKIFERKNSEYVGNWFILEVIDTISPDGFQELIELAENERRSLIENFGKQCNAGSLFYQILNANNKYRNLEDLMRYWWMAPPNANKKFDSWIVPKKNFTLLDNYEFKNNDLFVSYRLHYIKELQSFLEFKNAKYHQTYIDIILKKDSAIVPEDYFVNQANYIITNTGGITTDLTLYYFAMFNLKKIQSHSSEIYASVLPLMKDAYVKKRFDEEFQKLNLHLATTFKDISINEYTALDSLMESNKGKNLYIDFWAPWCGPCMSEMEPSKLLHKKLEDKNIQFVYVGCRCSESSWKATIANEDINGTNILLSDRDFQILSRRFEIPGIPYFLLVDKSGKIYNNAPRPSSDNIEKTILNME